MKLTKKIEAEILKVYEEFLQSYLTGDLATMAGFLTEDCNLIGTTEGEVFHSKKALMKYVKATIHQIAGVLTRKNSKIKLAAIGDTVAVDEQFDGYVNVNAQPTFYSVMRTTTILKYIRGKWLIAHMHGSIPDSNTEAGESLAAERIEKENRELKDAVRRHTKDLEDKNRELEMEASLERVRARAMAMQSSSELVDLIGMIHSEIARLDKNLDRSFIMLFDKSGDSTWWMSDSKNLSLKRGYHVPYHKHVPNLAILEGWRKRKKEWTYVLKGAVKKKWGEYIFNETELAQLPKIIKSDMVGVETVHLSSSFNKYGCVCTGSFEPLENSSLDLMVRFSRMFEQTYTRFLDLKKAEAQARESQIQLALERVRARTMAMQRSDELREAANLLFKQVRELKIPVWSCGYNIWEKGEKFCTAWMSTNDAILPPFKIPLTEPSFARFNKSRQKNEEFYAEELKGKELATSYKLLFSLPDFASSRKPFRARFSLPTSQINHVANFAHGNLIFIASEPVPEAWDIFKRFAKVFEQTYTRFLDLKNAEAQIREAQIEAALERIRSRSLAMHNSSEIKDVIRVVFDQLNELKVLHGTVGIQLFDFDKKDSFFWPGNTLQTIAPKVSFPFDKAMMKLDTCYRDEWQAMLSGKAIFNKVYTRKQKDRYFKYVFANNSLDIIFEESRKTIQKVETLTLCFIPEKNSALYADSFDGSVYTEAEFMVLKRTAKVFEQAYIRFLDLQKAEAQAHEAKIEAGLEKVRSTSMAMHESKDLEKVVGVLFDKLSELGLSFDGALICLVDKAKKTIQLWIATVQLTKPVNIIVPLGKEIIKNPVVVDLLSGKDTFNRAYAGAAKNKYFGYVAKHNRPKFPESITKFHFKQPAWTASFASEKNSSVGVDSWHGQTTTLENFQIIKRFARVFEQAYVRFLDLQKAEAQARDAQIEAALERVRSRTMAMQKGDELKEVASLLFSQIKDLGITCWTTGFNVWSDDGYSYEDYVTDPSGGFMDPYTIDTKQFPVLNEVSAARKRGDNFFVQFETGEEIIKTYEFLQKSADRGQFQKILDSGTTFPTQQVNHFVFGAKVSLLFVTYDHVPEAHDIFKRFGKAFEQTYTRFLDLKKAEGQAREAQIQLALERLRARTMAMHQSSELSEAASLMFEQLTQLGASLWICSFAICKKDSDIIEAWPSPPDGKMMDALYIPVSVDKFQQRAYEKWKKGGGFISDIAEGRQLLEDGEKLLAHPSMEKARKAVIESGIPHPTWVQQNAATFKHGFLLIVTTQPFAETKIFERFAKVFEQTYTRFLDLKNAEVQAKESQIQLALERIRARTMAMQKSDELNDVAILLFQQVSQLGINVWTTGFNAWSDDNNSYIDYITSPQGSLIEAYPIDVTKFHVFVDIANARKSGVDFWVQYLDAKATKATHAYLRKSGNTKYEKMVEDGYQFPSHQYNHFVFGSKVSVMFNTYEPAPEAHEIFKRFGKVFEQTYTRFLDLQKAEEQAREAQIEAALEKVRSTSLAMHYSDELEKVVAVLLEKLVELGLHFDGVGLNIFDKDKKSFQVWVATRFLTNAIKINMPYDTEIAKNGIIRDLWHALETGEHVFNRSYSGKDKNDYFAYVAMHNESKIPEELRKHNIEAKSWTATFAAEKNSLIVFDSWTGKTTSELDFQIVKRFSRVFEQAYVRFLDLQKAEAQAREAQIENALEKVRSTSLAMHHSDELEKVVVVLFDRLWDVGLRFDGALIFLFDKTKKSIQHWIAATRLTSSIRIDLPYGEAIAKNPIIKDLWGAIENGKDLFNTVYSGDVKNEYFRFIFDHNSDKIPDEVKGFILGADRWTIAFAAEKNSVVGFDSWSGQLTSEEDFQVLKRFSRVFEQAYRRFLDLQKAEAQAREAQIEAALEKVRSTSLAMHHSDELEKVISVLFEKLNDLGVVFDGALIYTFDKQKRGIEFWVDSNSLDVPIKLKLSHDDEFSENEIVKDLWRGVENGHHVLNKRYAGATKDNFYSRLAQINPDKIPERDRELIMAAESWTFTFAAEKNSIIGFDSWSGYQTKEEDFQLLKRFSRVFEQAYVRFLDLQKAEAQAREAQIEAAMERIRSRSLAMHRSDELREVVHIMFKKLDELKVIHGSVAIQVFDFDTKDSIFWVGNDLSIEPIKVLLPFDENMMSADTCHRDLWQAMEKGEPIFNKVYSKEQKDLWFQYVFAQNDLNTITQSDRDFILGWATHTVCFSPEKKSAVFADSWDGSVFSEAEFEVFKRAARVFEQAYTRFLDLKKAEAQAREAQIEAALERVRSRTMAMHKSEELLEVITVVCEQVQHVGIKFSTVSFGKNSGTFDMDFWAAAPDLNTPIRLYAPYKDISIYQRLKAAVDQRRIFFTDTFTAEETRIWYEHLIDHNLSMFNQKSREYLVSRPSMTRTTVLLKNVFLFAINHSIVSYSREENEIWVRFANVFEQAYTRFLDLQKAEAQAHEAQVEAALEKVRARTMGMQRSDELSEVAALMFQQVRSFGLESWGCGFNIWEKDQKECIGWMTSPIGGLVPPLPIPLTEHPLFIRFYESRQSGVDFWIQEMEGKDLEELYNYMGSLPILGELLRNVQTLGIQQPTHQFNHVVNFAQGNLIFITYEPCPEAHDIFKRFAKVFEQTYTRFLDLQKAEAQAREAQIEAALERVRSKTMAMQKSEELREVAIVLYEQLKNLGFKNGICSIVIMDASTGDFDCWGEGSADGYKFLQKYQVKYFDHPIHNEQLERWKNGDSFASITASGELKKSNDRYYFNETDFRLAPEETKALMMSLESVTWSTAYMLYGALLWAPTPVSDEQAKILQRFAKVFEQTYTRFLDLQKAEAQAREARIEAALERVRSKTMAMQKSEDLRDVTIVLYEQLKSLGFSNGTCAIIIMDASTGDFDWWMEGSADGYKFLQKYHVNYFDHPIHIDQLEKWKNGISYASITAAGDLKKSIDRYYFYETDFRLTPEPTKELMVSQESVTFSMAYMLYGAVSWSPQPVTEEEAKILQRFAKVFEQTYTRFLDLQKAEEQGRESQIQLALERIRARTMAMQRSEELAEVSQLLYQQFLSLGVETTTCAFMFPNEDNATQSGWTVLPDGTLLPKILDFPLKGDSILNERFASWKKKESLHHRSLYGEENKRHHRFLSERVAVHISEDIFEHLPEKVNFYSANYLQGYLFIITAESLSAEEQDILIRFAKTFEQTYTRFLDLEKAELQARESQIQLALERVRARTMAMHISKEVHDVSWTISDQLHQLGIEGNCTIALIDGKTGDMEWWTGGWEGKETMNSYLIQNINHDIHRAIVDGFNKGEKYKSIHASGELKKTYDEKLFSETGFRNAPEASDSGKNWMLSLESVDFNLAYNKHGALHFAPFPINEEQASILQRFASVFEQTYTRFLDLKNAEAQAREAQIEAALERVRSRAMAMHSAQELKDVVHELRKQIGVLGQKDLDTVVIQLIEESPDFLQSWAAMRPPGGDGEIQEFNGSVPKRGLMIIEEYLKAYEEGKQDYVLLNERDKLKQWVEFMSGEFPGAHQLIVDSIEKGNDRAYWSFSDFRGGSLLMVTNDPPEETSRALLRRFTNVFALAYRRFADLKQAEAQAREARIEAALERVRARAMAMHTANELNEVAHELRTQMGLLGQKDLNTCVIHLNEEFPDYVESFASLSEPGKDSEILDFHVMVPKRLKVIEQALAEYYSDRQDYILVQEGEAVKEWNDFLREIAPTAFAVVEASIGDEDTNTLRGYWSCADFQGGTMIFVTLDSPEEESRAMLRRFANVFGLAYRRFSDLKKAEAQAREATIEAALEKIRSRSLGMHRSEEVKEVVNILFEKLKELGLVFDGGAAIHLFKEGVKDSVMYVAAPELDGAAFCKLPYDEADFEGNTVILDVLGAKANGESIVNKRYSFEEKNKYFNYLFKHNEISRTDIPLNAKSYNLTLIAEKNCLLGANSWTDQQFSENDVEVLKRVTHVFEQAYIRFLDLQKAEALAREATIEAALEKIRSRSLGMHKSEEIKDVVAILFGKLKELGLVFDGGAAIHLFAEGSRDASIWVMSPELPEPICNNLPYNPEAFENNPIILDVWQAKETGTHIINRHYTFDQKNRYFDYVFKYNNMLHPTSLRDFIFGARAYSATFISEKNSLLGASSWTEQEFSDDDVDVLKRVARVFEQAYIRFIDLQKAEAQAREAVIESAMEKIRSRSLGMQKSEEIKEVVAILFEKLKELGLVFDGGASIHTFSPGTKDMSIWVTTEGAEPVHNKLPFDEEYADSPIMQDLIRAAETGEHILNRRYTREVKNRYFEYVGKHNDALRIPEEVRKSIMDADSFTVTHLAERNCLLGADSRSGQTFSESDIDIFKRAARVFDQAYVRFLDLQKAELHARETDRQASLDRVRAEIASMRTVQDLDRITPLIWRELNALNIPFIRCGVFIMDDGAETIHNFLATPDGKAIAVFDLPYNTPEPIASILTHWQRQKMYHEHWNEVALMGLGKIMVDRNVFSSIEQYLSTLPGEGFYPYCMPFQQGMLYVANVTELKDDELSVLQSLSDAFATAYARYDDFNKLEEAKQQVDTALVELKQTQQQLVQSEKMASLGELTAGIAHEIQNPLNFVNNFSEVSHELIDEMKAEIEAGNVQGATDLVESIKQNLEKITHHGKRADGIVKGMLQHSRTGSGQKEQTDINVLCDEYLRLAFHGYRAKDKSFKANFETNFDSTLPKVNVVPQDIGRVVLNLINNAFYAVSEKSKTLTDGYAPKVIVSTKRLDDKIEVRVGDNGPGISESIKEKVFQPFFTTKPTGQGTGLGLSLAYDIVTKLHGGELRLETKVGEGSEFIIVLPFAK